jgi:Winged helix DNA-binding domain
MRHFEAAERRRRLLVRHHLARPGSTVEQVAGDLVGVHSSDPATVVLSMRARLEPFAVEDLEDALYERRTLVRMLGMRRTMFVVPLDLAGVMDVSCAKALVPGERRRLVQLLAGAGITDEPDAWIERVRAETLAALEDGQPVPASTLTKRVPDLAHQLRMAVGKRYESTVGVSTRMLFLMSTQGDIVRTRPLGTWLSSQYRWTRTVDWIGALPTVEPDAARAELVRRWLRAFGPGALDDIAWWTKWTRAQVTAALGEVGAVQVTAATSSDETTDAWVLPDDLDDTPEGAAAPDEDEPVALLPALDSSVMAWRHRGWYLGPHGPRLFDRNGNAGPTVWLGGRVVGAWGQREGGEVVTALLEPVSAAATRRVRDAAARLTDWMAGVRVTPRFTSPLERELATGTVAS